MTAVANHQRLTFGSRRSTALRPFYRAHHHDGTPGVVEDTGGYRAEKQTAETASPSVTDDEELRVARRIGQNRDRVATRRGSPHRDRGPCFAHTGHLVGESVLDPLSNLVPLGGRQWYGQQFLLVPCLHGKHFAVSLSGGFDGKTQSRIAGG